MGRTLIDHVPSERAVVVAFRSEIAGDNAGELTAGITEAMNAAAPLGARLLVADLSAARFRGSSGLTALMDAQRRAAQRGVEFVVVAEESGSVENVLVLTGAISVLTVHSSVGQAFEQSARRRAVGAARGRVR